MHYALMIYAAEEIIENYSTGEREQALEGHRALQKRAKSAKVFVQATQLMPTHAATSVRGRDGKITVIDGPFAETKEQFLGFYVMDCDSLDQAMEYAKMIPNVHDGCIEIRPIEYLENRGGAVPIE